MDCDLSARLHTQPVSSFQLHQSWPVLGPALPAWSCPALCSLQCCVRQVLCCCCAVQFPVQFTFTCTDKIQCPGTNKRRPTAKIQQSIEQLCYVAVLAYGARTVLPVGCSHPASSQRPFTPDSSLCSIGCILSALLQSACLEKHITAKTFPFGCRGGEGAGPDSPGGSGHSCRQAPLDVRVCLRQLSCFRHPRRAGPIQSGTVCKLRQYATLTSTISIDTTLP